MLTPKQYKLLMFIDNFIKENGCCPSFEEMKQAVGIKSKSGIHALIEELIERDFVKKLPHKARALEVLRTPRFKPREIIEEEKKIRQALLTAAVPVPLYGKIAAGTPIAAIADENESITVPLEMVSRGSFYALTVEGESMIEAGIMDRHYPQSPNCRKWTNRGGSGGRIGSHAQSVAEEKRRSLAQAL